jgi:uncharacterized protein YpmS
MTDKKNLLTLYFPVAALGGLLLIVISLIILLQMLFILILGTSNNRGYMSSPPAPREYIGELENKNELTGSQKEALNEWERDYKRWQKDVKKGYQIPWRDQLNIALPFLIIGVPIFIYHLRIIKKQGNDE